MTLSTKLIAAGVLVAILGGLVAFYGHSQKKLGDLQAKLDRATADRIALETRTKNVTMALEKTNRDLKTIKENRNAAKDRLDRVADPTGCLDTVLPADFTDELRRAYGGNDSAP